MTPPRALDANEREIVRRLVAAAPSGDRRVAECQAEHARVVEQCLEDDGSVILTVDRESCPAFAWLRGLLTEASDLQSPPIEVLLHARDGYLWFLEVVTYGAVTPHGLPPADSLTYLGGQDRIR